jgi:hypothetical protein
MNRNQTLHKIRKLTKEAYVHLREYRNHTAVRALKNALDLAEKFAEHEEKMKSK